MQWEILLILMKLKRANFMFNNLFKLKNKNSHGKIYKTFMFLGLRFKFLIGFANSLYVNRYLSNIKPYKASSHKIWDVLPDERKDIIKLDWNEAVIPPSPLVIKRVKELIEEPNFLNLYPKTYNKELLDKISEYVNIPVENIQYFSSSDSTHEYIAKLYIKENDKVLIQGPSYDNFRLTAEANGARIYYSEVEPVNFQFDEEKFDKAISEISPTFVYICSPNNPCGYINKTEYLEYLVKKYTGTMFLVDEAYAEFSGVSAKELCLKYENILVTRTLSKAFAMANLRFGYIIASESNIESISSIRNPKNINTFTQETAIATFSDIEYMKNYVQEVKVAKEYFLQEIKKYSWIKAFDSNSNFVLMKFENNGLKYRFFEYLKENNIFVRDLTQSEILYNCLRITIGTTNIMKRVLEKFKEFEQIELNPVVKQENKVALFDFCETLVNFQTGNAYVDYVRQNKNSFIINLRYKIHMNFWKLKGRFIKGLSGKEDYLGVIKGLSKVELERLALNFYIEKVRPNFNLSVISELKKLKKDGYRIYIVSGGYDVYLKYFLEEFKLDGIFSTKLNYDEKGIFTGKFYGIDCMGANKITLLKKFFEKEPFEAYETVAYSDNISDLPLLKFCKKGYLVLNQDKDIPNWVKEKQLEVLYI